jgi:hypothetical protein
MPVSQQSADLHDISSLRSSSFLKNKEDTPLNDGGIWSTRPTTVGRSKAVDSRLMVYDAKGVDESLLTKSIRTAKIVIIDATYQTVPLCRGLGLHVGGSQWLLRGPSGFCLRVPQTQGVR